MHSTQHSESTRRPNSGFGATTQPGPLTGFRIVDLSRALAGPYCTTLLADLGAEIIKIESVTGGDPSRSWAPFDQNHSLYHDSINRNKRSVAVNLYSEEGKQILDQLIQTADGLVENFKPGTLDKMGYDADRLRALNPRLVVASVSGFGETGPLSHLPGLDQIMQAVTGITSVTGPVGSVGYRVGLSIVDLASGMTAAVGLLGALLGRERDQGPSRVSTSLFETALSLSLYQSQNAITNGVVSGPMGNDHPSIAPYGVFATASEPLVIAVTTDAHWRAFADVVELPEVFEDPRYATSRSRNEHRSALKESLQERLLEEAAEFWINRLNDAGIPCGAILNYAQIVAHPHTEALSMIHEVTRADGTPLRLLRGPLSVDGTPTGVALAPPALGSDSSRVLADLGYSQEEIEALLASGDLYQSASSLEVSS
ncbi:CaiB/BaiF CoA transferase family protein [Leucobacter sp. M11]|uniref:CaiB/BaiF CoA transferase family protein n=1 Tax=Leucobacter sp. M11 TaxID=2993565 RepID=UPI002D801464|nr:CoA transferase [Leucobacter sp. M11]MEB4615375.1 CoA transferase [Leucobacter sp. M11]